MKSNNMKKYVTKNEFKMQMKPMLFGMLALLALTGCFRGTPSEEPAIHLNPNMDDQLRYDPQEKSNFFSDGRTMRDITKGTVARGALNEDDALYLGTDANGAYIKYIPIKLNDAIMARGKERYDIFCAPCHAFSGDGKGIVVQRGFLPPPSFFQENVLAFDDGYIYEVITKGVRNMPQYRKQIPDVNDRWAIVAYVRALQKTQTATKADLPKEKLNELN